MNELSLASILKKKKRHFYHHRDESEDQPVMFPLKNFLKIDKELKVKQVEKPLLSQKKDEINKFVLAKSLNIGYYLIMPLLLGIFLGIWLDKVFKTKPTFILLFFFIGIIGSFYNLWKTTKEFK